MGLTYDEQIVPNEKGCWYLTYTRECPVCGGGDTTRIRQQGPPPEDHRARYEYEQVYDYCMEG